jgi:hypothetical protein
LDNWKPLHAGFGHYDEEERDAFLAEKFPGFPAMVDGTATLSKDAQAGAYTRSLLSSM